MTGGPALTSRGPDFFSMSYIQSRPIGLLGDVPRTIGALCRAGFQSYPLDYFYGVELGRNNNIGRAKLENVQLSFTDSEGCSYPGTGTLHLLLWSVGFVVLRLTFNDEGLNRPDRRFRSWFKDMHGLEHDLPEGQGLIGLWSADLAGMRLEVNGGVRRFFDLISAGIHEYLQGRPLVPADLSSVAQTADRSIEYAESRVERGELRFAYPSTFGSHSELMWSSPRKRPRKPEAWIPGLMGSGMDGERMACDIDEHAPQRWWYLSDFQSIFVACAEAPSLEAGVCDVTRASMIEYIAYRRGALLQIRRETHQITAERQRVQKAIVADWMWLASAVTDDYVLGGWSSTLFERVRQRFHSFEGIRNIFDLEAQVSRNIEAFQGRLDAESDRIGVVTGVLFGIVAATALVPVGQLAVQLIFHLRGGYADFPDYHPLVFLGVIVAMISVVGVASWLMLRRARSLSPPKMPARRHIPRRGD